MTAHVVIADLSAGVPETFYEPGIRHALRSYATLIISEDGTRDRIDPAWPNVLYDRRPGGDIGFDEVTRFRDVLTTALAAALSEPTVDSPVYKSSAAGRSRGPAVSSAGPSPSGGTASPFRLPPRPRRPDGREKHTRKVCDTPEGDIRMIVVAGASDTEVFAVAVEAAYRSAGSTRAPPARCSRAAAAARPAA